MAKQEFKSPLEKISAAKLKAVKKKKMNLKPLVGKWINCDSKTRGLVRVEIGSRRGVLVIHPFGACTPNPCDWGTVKGRAYAESVGSTSAVAFSSTFKFSFKQTIVTGHLCEGCMMIETFNRFTDGSGRSDYYSRDCFYRK